MRVSTLVTVASVALFSMPAAAQDIHVDVDLGELQQQIEVQLQAVMQQTGLIERVREAVERQGREFQRQIDRQRRFSGPEFTDTFSRTVRLGRSGSFELSNIAGDISITGGGGDDVRIQAVKRVRRQNETEARALLRAIDIQVIERSGFVEVRTELPSRRNVSAVVDYTVALPSGANVDVKTVSGAVRVSNVRGELRAESISGDVTAASVTRVRALKSLSGNIELSDVDGDDIAANTASGSLTVRNVKARSLEFESVSGDMRFTDTQSDRVALKTISGNIEYGGRLARSGRYDMTSHSGNVRIAPIGTVAFDLEASTFSGDVRSDFPLTLRGGGIGNGFTGGRGPRLNRTIRGSIGDGGALLSIRSFSGNVVIVKR
jgi:DUF4097 and DUF4098 domain-containing protein YvlB